MESHHGPQTYILVCDLARKVMSFRLVGIQTPEPSDPFFAEFRSGLKDQILQIAPHLDVRVIDMGELAAKILMGVQHLDSTLLKNAFVVSTCSEIALPIQGHTLEVNRVVDDRGVVLGIGPRPGHPPVDHQIDGILSMAAGRPLVIVEDGSFTGSTLSYVIDRLHRKKADVIAVVAGFIFPKAMERLKDVFRGVIHTIEHFEQPIDWVPDHDFVPFLPGCGRIVGALIRGDAHPFYTFEGYPYSIPYLLPFAPPEAWMDWTGLTGSVQDARNFSRFCIVKSRDLFEELERLNDKHLTIRDIQDVRPRISVPFRMDGDDSMYRMSSVRICGYLTDIMQEVLW